MAKNDRDHDTVHGKKAKMGIFVSTLLLKVEVVELLLAMKYNNVISSGTHDL